LANLNKGWLELKRLLIANRGEIAVRIIHAARLLGIETVAIYSKTDEGSLHVRLADQKISLSGSQVKDSYLNMQKILDAAIQSGADAIHPGYGLFSENPDFAKAVIDAGLIFVGPSVEAVSVMADKHRARERVSQFDVPVIPGTIPTNDLKSLSDFANSVHYPVIIKAVAGGGGRGMRIVHKESELEEAINQAKREAKAAFGNDEVFLEKFLIKPRHIEVQIFGDNTGKILHFGERECSIQRRNQKLVEEARAPNLHPKLLHKILSAALKAGKSVNYTSAGTVEFLVSDGTNKDSEFYFLEMNTRIQVEHPVTEVVTNTDLVRLQLEIARGEKLSITQKDVTFNGHAIQFRINSEVSYNSFMPTSGEISYISRPFGPGVREDSWVEAGTRVSAYYDSLLTKLIVSASSREEAIKRARAVLDSYILEGIDTTLPFHRWLLEQEDFCNGMVDVGWLERNYKGEIKHATRVGPFTLPPRPQYINAT
jgi:acetyl-CoA carboxylase, biotin carboxylase subunit